MTEYLLFFSVIVNLALATTLRQVLKQRMIFYKAAKVFEALAKDFFEELKSKK